MQKSGGYTGPLVGARDLRLEASTWGDTHFWAYHSVSNRGIAFRKTCGHFCLHYSDCCCTARTRKCQICGWDTS